MRRHLRAQVRLYRRRLRRFVVHSVLHADDPPDRIARGVAVGVFITFTPTIGFQMVLSLFFAWLLRANKLVGLPIVWISNPATMIPIFYLCYLLGRTILQQESVGIEFWAELAHPPATWLESVRFYWQHFMKIFTPLWVGSLAISSVLAYASYYLSYYAICGYRMKRWGQLMPPSAAPLPTVAISHECVAAESPIPVADSPSGETPAE
jgi:uncharacterized protein (DUF2062 family)